MTIQGAEGDSSERRSGVGQRVHFEALVAVGEASGGGFEAESMDVSPEGMRLRTAYLPKIGDKLLCRFDGVGGEIVVHGEVCWRNEGSHGGEFGLRFIGLDATTEQAVRAMCQSFKIEGDGGDEEREVEPSGPQRGARVRLHIEGLGSPMKARVRDGDQEEVEVGSNLEFLKVGRPLELEDVDQGCRREVYIDRVKVEVDAATNVPQLVVFLRSQKTKRRADTAQAPMSVEAQPSKEAKAEQHTLDEQEEQETSEEPAAVQSEEADASDDASEEGQAEDEPQREGRSVVRNLGGKAAQATMAAAGKVGPAVASAGVYAKGAFQNLWANLRKRRAKDNDSPQGDAPPKKGGPRRMTAPPPVGALRSEGRRIVRRAGDTVAEDSAALPSERKPRIHKKAAAIGSVVGLAAVLVLFGTTRGLPWRSQTAAPDPQAAAVVTAPAAPTLPAEAASGVPTANVPLFGPTPLSTTEPVPTADPAEAVAGADAPAGLNPGEDEPADLEVGDSKQWGQGDVKNPTILKLKMDGAIERVNGASGAMGFTVSLPERRALTSGSGLARKDKRIASVRVVNTPDGSEVTLQFKDGVPAYLAKAKGDRLEIALGNDAPPQKKVAAKSKKDKKSAKAKKDTSSKSKSNTKKTQKKP